MDGGYYKIYLFTTASLRSLRSGVFSQYYGGRLGNLKKKEVFTYSIFLSVSSFDVQINSCNDVFHSSAMRLIY